MLCEVCNQNPATIHIQEIINGEKKSLHICPDCAADKSKENPILEGINLAEMLYDLSEQIGSPTLPSQSENDEDEDEEKEASSVMLVCPTCQWNTTKFRKLGRLGCSHCYETFKNILGNALKNMHRGALHVGKHPGMRKNDETSKNMMEIMNLQKELEELVQREEYEKAAVVRDKINNLKKKIDQTNGQ